MSLESSARKMVAQNLIKPKAKLGLSLFLDLIFENKYEQL